MIKAYRILRDIVCIIAIIILPMWVLKMVGIVDIVERGGIDESTT